MALRVHGLNITSLKHLILNNRLKIENLSKESESLRQQLNQLPHSAYSKENKKLLEDANAILDLVREVSSVEKQYEEYLASNPVDVEDEVLFFTMYSTLGTRKVVAGTSIEDAFIKAGFSENEAKMVQWYDVGITNTHNWNTKKRAWVRK